MKSEQSLFLSSPIVNKRLDLKLLKDHVKVDRTTKLIEDYEVTDAYVHDSQALEDLVEEDDGTLHADSAYSGEKIETILKENGVKGEIREKGYRNHPLTEKQKKSNRKKSRIRARVEHICGFMTNTMRDGLKMRWIGMRGDRPRPDKGNLGMRQQAIGMRKYKSPHFHVSRTLETWK